MLIGELVCDLLEWYRSVADKARMADEVEARWTNHLRVHFEHVRADEFGTRQQRAYRAFRKQEGAAPATVNRELQVIRSAYILAVEAEPPKVPRVPKFEIVREENARKVFIDSASAEKLKSAAYRLSLIHI